MHMGGPAAPHGSGPPPPHQVAMPHRTSSGLSGQLMPAAAVSSSTAPGGSTPRGGPAATNAQAGQHADSSVSAPPPNSDGPASYPQAIPVSVPDHLSKPQGVAVSTQDATLPGAVRLQVAQTPQGQQVRIPAGYAMYHLPGGQVVALPGNSTHRPVAAALHDGGHGMPDVENARYTALDGMTYMSSATAGASGAGQQSVRAHKAPPAGARAGPHDQQQHPQQMQVGQVGGSTAPGQHGDSVTMERVGSGSHAWPVSIPVHSSAVASVPVSLHASGEPLSSYAAAASADAANDRNTPSHSQREESQGTPEGHGDVSAKAHNAALSGSQAPSEGSLTACTQRRRSNPQLQGGPVTRPCPSAGHRRASSETRQCMTDYSGASSVTSADDAPPGRASKTGSSGTAPAAGLDSALKGSGSLPVSAAPEQGTAVHVLSPQGSFHNVPQHLHPDIQVLRPYLPQQYVELRSSGGTGAHHTNAHAGVPASQGPQTPPGAIYLSHSPGSEGLQGGVVRAGVPGAPVVVSTGGMAQGHHLHMPLGAPGQGPATVFIPHPHPHPHAHAHAHAHSHQAQTQQAGTGGGGTASSLGPHAHVIPGNTMHGMPLHLHLPPHHQLAHGIEGAHQGMYSIVQMPQGGVYMVRLHTFCILRMRI